MPRIEYVNGAPLELDRADAGTRLEDLCGNTIVDGVDELIDAASQRIAAGAEGGHPTAEQIDDLAGRLRGVYDAWVTEVTGPAS